MGPNMGPNKGPNMRQCQWRVSDDSDRVSGESVATLIVGSTHVTGAVFAASYNIYIARLF